MTIEVLLLLTLCVALVASSTSTYGVAAQLMTEEECTADTSRSTVTLSTFVTRIFSCELPEGDGTRDTFCFSYLPPAADVIRARDGRVVCA